MQRRAAPRIEDPHGLTSVRPLKGETGHGAKQTPVVSPSMRDRLVRLAYRFLWNRDDAEDAVQDALTVAHERVGDLRDAGRWWSWVCRIVVNRCQERGRQRLRRERHEQPLMIAEARRQANVETDATEDKTILRRVLQDLLQRQQEVIVLRHLQEMSYEQVGEVLGIAPATARVHARAARETVRKLMLQRCPDWFDRAAKPEGVQP